MKYYLILLSVCFVSVVSCSAEQTIGASENKNDQVPAACFGTLDDMTPMPQTYSVCFYAPVPHNQPFVYLRLDLGEECDPKSNNLDDSDLIGKVATFNITNYCPEDVVSVCKNDFLGIVHNEKMYAGCIARKCKNTWKYSISKEGSLYVLPKRSTYSDLDNKYSKAMSIREAMQHSCLGDANGPMKPSFELETEGINLIVNYISKAKGSHAAPKQCIYDNHNLDNFGLKELVQNRFEGHNINCPTIFEHD